MNAYWFAILAALVFAYAAFSGRLSRTFLTGPIIFTALGLIIGPQCLEMVKLSVDPALVKTLLEGTLVLVLFTDAMSVNAKSWRKQAYIPERLLGIGLPLTIALGFVAALVLFGKMDVWEAALVGAILAPTDAALGLAVISNPRVPLSIRQGLNVESGLNDGIVFPIVMLLITATTVATHGETGGQAVWFIVKTIILSGLIGIAVGWLGGRLASAANSRKWADPIWLQIGVAALAALAYALAVPFEGSGFISAWVAGFVFGLVVREKVSDLKDFPDALGQILVVLSFFVFGNTILSSALGRITWQIVFYAALSLTVVRMVPVALAMVGSKTRWPSLLYMGWFGPRGLASIVFAGIIVEEAKLPNAELIVTIMAITVGLSILLHGLTAWWGSSRYADWYQGHSELHAEISEGKAVNTFVPRRHVANEGK
jgi:sodium/hydrogen antiporter